MNDVGVPSLMRLVDLVYLKHGIFKMTYVYNSSNGTLSKDGNIIGIGYSGFGEGKNNPLWEDHPNIGPIPRGTWEIVGEPFDSPEHGPYCLRLAPLPETKTFSRGGFLMHGDSIVHPGLASKGCIIMLHAVRMEVFQSGDKLIQVV